MIREKTELKIATKEEIIQEYLAGESTFKALGLKYNLPERTKVAILVRMP